MNRILTTLTLIGLSFSAVTICSAQTTKESTEPVTVTGCLAQGDQANQYSIKDSSGKTYDLTGTKVNMKAHLGHEVTITGTPTKATEAASAKAASGKAEENLEVSELKMVSTTCK